MSKTKKFYWLKLKNDFFNQREIKKLRKVAGGDTFTIIYLKMQLLSIKNEGVITYEGTEEDLSEQLAVELDEDIENVQLTIAYLMKNKLIENISEDDYLLNKVPDMIGSETDSAERVRRLRQRKNEQKALQSNGDVTKGNTEIELEKEKEIKKETPPTPYKEIFNHYITLPHLVKHKKYTESMKKAIAKAMKECGLTMDECKELLDRHNEVVRMTKDEGKYKVEKRGLQDFFGQKAYQSQKLICEEYMEGGVKYEKYLANKTQPQDNERQRELDKERSELMF